MVAGHPPPSGGTAPTEYGLPAHKSRAGAPGWTTPLAAHRAAARLRAGPQPGGTTLGNVKGRELANLYAAHLGEVAKAARRGLARVTRHPTLAQSFLAHAGLSL